MEHTYEFLRAVPIAHLNEIILGLVSQLLYIIIPKRKILSQEMFRARVLELIS